MNFTDFQSDLQGFQESEIVFVGLGNRMRGDDAVGLELLDKVQKSGIFSGACFLSAGINPENFLEQILSADPGLVVFLDACDFGDSPGTIRWLEKDEIETSGISTHAYSIAIVEKYLNLERKVVCRYLGIQPASTGTGEDLSPGMLQEIDAFFE